MTPVKLPGGPNVILTLGKSIINISESILLLFIKSDLTSVSMVPDYVWPMVSCAALWVVGVNFMFFERFERDLVGWGTELVKKTVQVMKDAAGLWDWEGDHTAKRCALLIQGMVDSWERKSEFDLEKLKEEMAKLATSGVDASNSRGAPAADSFNGSSLGPGMYEYASASSPPHPPPHILSAFNNSSNFMMQPPASTSVPPLDNTEFSISSGQGFEEMWNMMSDDGMEMGLGQSEGYDQWNGHTRPQPQVYMHMPAWQRGVMNHTVPVGVMNTGMSF
jgi:hypothetical protein